MEFTLTLLEISNIKLLYNLDTKGRTPYNVHIIYIFAERTGILYVS